MYYYLCNIYVFLLSFFMNFLWMHVSATIWSFPWVVLSEHNHILVKRKKAKTYPEKLTTPHLKRQISIFLGQLIQASKSLELWIRPETFTDLSRTLKSQPIEIELFGIAYSWISLIKIVGKHSKFWKRLLNTIKARFNRVACMIRISTLNISKVTNSICIGLPMYKIIEISKLVF